MTTAYADDVQAARDRLTAGGYAVSFEGRGNFPWLVIRYTDGRLGSGPLTAATAPVVDPDRLTAYRRLAGQLGLGGSTATEIAQAVTAAGYVGAERLADGLWTLTATYADGRTDAKPAEAWAGPCPEQLAALGKAIAALGL